MYFCLNATLKAYSRSLSRYAYSNANDDGDDDDYERTTPHQSCKIQSICNVHKQLITCKLSTGFDLSDS